MSLPFQAAVAAYKPSPLGAPGMSPRDRLATLLSPELVTALDELVAERVADELDRQKLRESGAPWLTLDQAAERLGCSRDAVRMRCSRGRLVTRRHGRRLYVSAESVAELA